MHSEPSLHQRWMSHDKFPKEYISLWKLYGALRSLKFLLLTFVVMVTHQFAQIWFWHFQLCNYNFFVPVRCEMKVLPSFACPVNMLHLKFIYPEEILFLSCFLFECSPSPKWKRSFIAWDWHATLFSFLLNIRFHNNRQT